MNLSLPQSAASMVMNVVIVATTRSTALLPASTPTVPHTTKLNINMMKCFTAFLLCLRPGLGTH